MLKNIFLKLRYWLPGKNIKIVVVVFVAALAFADFLAMKNMFTGIGLSEQFWVGEYYTTILSEANVFAATAALMLEGAPFFMGREASVMADETKYKVNDGESAKYKFIVASVCFGIAILVIWAIRILLIINDGGFASFFSGKNFGGSREKNASFIKHVFLFFEPLLTSMLAFVASWTAFRSESHTHLERHLKRLHGQYLAAQSRFLDVAYKNDDARTALWGSLNINNQDMPKTMDGFRRDCFKKIREKLIENCKEEFPDQVQRYNVEISSLLQEFIGEMGRHTTTSPRDIERLKIEEFLQNYDKDCTDHKHPENAWGFDSCGKALEKELNSVINNAVVVAQFKTSTKPYFMEGD